MTSESSLQWPELYGFWIYGNGPSYVIWVEPGSISETAGIRVGDRIVELDNKDVSRLPAQTIKAMARSSQNNPPAISVQSFYQEIELLPTASGNLGLSVRGDMPVLVDSVDPDSPAWNGGIRPNDVIVEVNNKPIKYAESLKPLINSRGKMLVKYIPILRSDELSHATKILSDPGRKVSQTDLSDGKLKRAQNFYSTMNRVFSDEPDKRKFIINELKTYTDQGDINRLTSSLNNVLLTPQQRTLLTDIRPFIPPKQQTLFDHLTSLHNSSMVFNKPPPPETTPSLIEPSTSKMSKRESMPRLEMLSSPFDDTQQQPKYAFKVASGKRRLLIKRDPKEHYGFTLKGNRPVMVEFVEPNSLAEKAGLLANDFILSVNGVNVEAKNYSDVLDILNNCESSPILEVMQRSDYEQAKIQREPSDIDVTEMRNQEGKTFKEKEKKKVKEVLTPEEKYRLKKALLDYNYKKDVDDFMDRSTRVLDTNRKKSLWFYLLPILEEEHQEYAQMYLEKHKEATLRSDASEKMSRKSSLARRKSRALETDSDHSQEIDEDRYRRRGSRYLRSSKQYSSAPSLVSMSPSVTRQMEENELVMKFAQQLEYLLNTRERAKIKHTLSVFNSNRDIAEMVESIDRVLDTPSKRTLWFHLIPLLDEDDQEYVKRRLLLVRGEHAIGATAAYYETDSVPFFDLSNESENDASDLNWARVQHSREIWQLDDTASQQQQHSTPNDQVYSRTTLLNSYRWVRRQPPAEYLKKDEQATQDAFLMKKKKSDSDDNLSRYSRDAYPKQPHPQPTSSSSSSLLPKKIITVNERSAAPSQIVIHRNLNSQADQETKSEYLESKSSTAFKKEHVFEFGSVKSNTID